METTKYDDPRLAINRVYTRGGDKGETSLAGGQRVPKDALRIEAYGTVDELNATIGVARETAAESLASHSALAELDAILKRVQHELFNAGSILATLPQDVHPRQARVGEAEITQLEAEIDKMNSGLPALRSFVLPGGCRLNAELHVCRTVCRRAERICVALARQENLDGAIVRYLNRLSDALFVWSRWASHTLGVAEILWEPNRAASGRRDDTLKEPFMQNENRRPLAIALTIAGGLLRLAPHPWNFAPVGGSSLFAGARLRGWQAFLLPILLMAITDPLVGGYSIATPFVYLSFLITVWIGRRLRASESPILIGVAALILSVQFFLITNFAAWLGYYPHTWAGFVTCYRMAIPFYPPTLLSDLLTSAVLFGLHAWLSRRVYTPERVSQSQPQTA